MNYTDAEIELARQLQRDGLDWEPKAGHYVFDETGFCKQTSPFQPQVYFILNYPYFMKTVGGVDRFKEIMTWLPTWDDARSILESLGVSNEKVLEHLSNEQAFAFRTERIALYQMISDVLNGQ